MTTVEQTAPEPRRGRGRPRKHTGPMVDFRLRIPEALHAEIAAAAAAAGHSLNDEILLRCTRRTSPQG